MAEEKNTKRISPQTQAIIDRLKAEGDLVRNSGTNSIKSVKAELSKFNDVFQAMNISLGGITKQGAATLALAEQDAKLRALNDEERENFYKKEAEMAQRQQELDNQKLIKAEKAAAAEKRERKSWFSGISGLFGGIVGFFKKWGLILSGLAFAYEFVAGYLEESLGINLPTIKEGIKNMSTWLQETDWQGLSNSFKSLTGLSPIVIGLGLAMTQVSFWLKALPGMLKMMATGRLPGMKPPIVTPGTAGAPGTTTTPDGDPRRLRDMRVLRDPETGRFTKNTWWNRLRLFGNADLPGGKFVPGAAGAAVSAGAIALGIASEERLGAEALEQQLLQAAEARRKTFTDVLVETGLSTATGAGVGAGLGALAGGVGAGPGALAGGISGAAWGFATSIVDGVVREIRDFGDTGVDELPNTLQWALQEEAELAGSSLEHIRASYAKTAEIAQQFIEENDKAVQDHAAEIEELEQRLQEAGSDKRKRRAIEAQIKRRNEDFDLLQTQYDVSRKILERRLQEIEHIDSGAAEEERKKLQQIRDGNLNVDDLFSSNQQLLENLISLVDTGLAGSSPVIIRNGDVNNFNNTSMQRSSTGVYRMNSFGGGSGGGYGNFVAVPGLVS